MARGLRAERVRRVGHGSRGALRRRPAHAFTATAATHSVPPLPRWRGVSPSDSWLLALAQGASIGEVFQAGIAVAIAAVPEGLPAVVTITMAVGIWRMARRRGRTEARPAA